MNITVRNLQKKLPISPRAVKRALGKALKLLGEDRPGELTVCFVTDKFIKELNLLYLGELCPTDVLSFEISKDPRRFAGDIVVSAETAARNAQIFDTSPLYEARLYAIHGLLHLFGYDDHSQNQRNIMRKKEASLLKEVFD